MKAMSDTTIIGKDSQLSGKISGRGDVEIHGHLEGDIEVEGEISIESEGSTLGDLTGRCVTVRGAVKGDLVASERIELGDGARVVGDLRAPRIIIATTALVRGHVATGESNARAPRATNGTARHAAPAKEVEAPRARTEQREHRPAPPPPAPRERESARNVARRPPPPAVVPVLKKGAKAVQKRR